MSDLSAVTRHPLVRELGADPIEQGHVDSFAIEMARWLVGEGAPHSALGRVVTALAAHDLADARTLCAGRPRLAIEAAARAVAWLWPHLRLLQPKTPSEEAGDDADGSALSATLDAVDPSALGRQTEDGAIEADAAQQRLERYLPGVGWEDDPTPLDTTLLDQLAQVAQALRDHPVLREIAEQLGRSHGQRPRNEGGSERVAGVHLAGDVARALPAELALLGDPDSEDLFYQRLAEHRLLSLQLAGTGLDGVRDGQRRGPIIACVDTSGSMRGQPELLAKALVLALCQVALPRNRTVHLLLFSGPEERTELRLRRGANSLAAVAAFLQHSFGGGTDFDTPLLRALELVDERELKRADVLVLTDGLARAEPRVIQQVRAARERTGLGVWSVVFGRETAGVRPFSDEVRLVGP